MGVERFEAIVGMGSNLGDRVACLTSAAARLGEVATLLAGSALYESDPIGGPEQDTFLNAAVKVSWSNSLVELLDVLMDIEAMHGRGLDVRAAEVRWGPRYLDLDLLWARRARGDGTRNTSETWEPVIHRGSRLVVPHPRLRERAFALRPLLDIEANAVDPITHRPYRTILVELKHQRISKAAFGGWPFDSVPVD